MGSRALAENSRMTGRGFGKSRSHIRAVLCPQCLLQLALRSLGKPGSVGIARLRPRGLAFPFRQSDNIEMKTISHFHFRSGVPVGAWVTAVEGDVLYAAPMMHQMAAEAMSGPSVRLAMGGYSLINMTSTAGAVQ